MDIERFKQDVKFLQDDCKQNPKDNFNVGMFEAFRQVLEKIDRYLEAGDGYYQIRGNNT